MIAAAAVIVAESIIAEKENGRCRCSSSH